MFNMKLEEKSHKMSFKLAPLGQLGLITSCHWKICVPFCLRKERPENVCLTLTVDYRKIVQKKKLCHSKQQ